MRHRDAPSMHLAVCSSIPLSALNKLHNNRIPLQARLLRADGTLTTIVTALVISDRDKLLQVVRACELVVSGEVTLTGLLDNFPFHGPKTEVGYGTPRASLFLSLVILKGWIWQDGF